MSHLCYDISSKDGYMNVVVITFVPAVILHSCESDTGSIKAGHWELEGEGLIVRWACRLLNHLSLLALDHLVLNHQADFRVGI